MKKNLTEYQKIHLIGIGGASMYSIAAMLKNDGKIVTGSDTSYSENITYLEKLNIPVTIGHNPDLIKNVDLIIYTAAIANNDPELLEAKKHHIECLERAIFLGEYTKNYENLICISGTHGKSTTTGMIATIFLNANLFPTVQIGASLKKINGNYYIGEKKYFILEACEYVDSFLHFNPTSEVILNIDNDHLDYFGTIENTKKSFQKYINLLPKDGLIVLNADDLNCRDLEANGRTLKNYGINNEAYYQAKNITTSLLGFPIFDLYIEGHYEDTYSLNVLGKHNVLNALAAIAIAANYNIDGNTIKKSLEEYSGVGRRLEYLGTYKGAHIFDDFAHHPTEIKATYEATKGIKHHKTWAIFQSHTFSRTFEHLNDFAQILAKFDHIIICDIYPAREINIWNVKESELVNLIKKNNPNVIHIPTYEKIATHLQNNIQENDLIITIGAGPIYKVADILLNQK